MNEHPIGLRDGTRVALRGNPTAEEAAAIVLALDAARQADEARRRPRRRPAWQAAARREAVGGRLIAGPSDLR